MQTKAVIFDYGAVLSTHPSPAEFQPLADLAGMDPLAFYDLYWTHRLDYDRSSITAEQYWAPLGEATGKVISPELRAKLIAADVELWLTLQRPMIDYARLLKQSGYRTAILSNMPLELGNHLRSHSGLFSLFDHVTLSCDVRSVKPEPQIYFDCLNGLGVAPNEAVFLDDRIANVEGAAKIGLPAYHFHSAVQFAQEGPARYAFPNFPSFPNDHLLISARDVR